MPMRTTAAALRARGTIPRARRSPGMRDSDRNRHGLNRSTGLAAILLLALPHGIASAVVGPELQAEGWRELPNPNKAENTYTLGPEGAIEVVSNNSVSTLYLPVEVDIREQPVLSWRWRVDEPAPATDLAAKGEDDCSLAVYVGPLPSRGRVARREHEALHGRIRGRRGCAGASAPLRVLRPPRAG